MAGRARTNALTDELDKRVADTFDHDPVHDDSPRPTALDYVCHWMECGKTAKALAADLSNSLAFDVDYAALMRYLRNSYGESAVESAMDQARTRASHSLAEDAMGLIDAADRDSSSAVSKAAAQARSRQWMAERYNPSRFGQSKGVNVSISVGDLHLQALLAVPKGVTGAPVSALASVTSGETSIANPLPVHQIAQSGTHTSD